MDAQTEAYMWAKEHLKRDPNNAEAALADKVATDLLGNPKYPLGVDEETLVAALNVAFANPPQVQVSYQAKDRLTGELVIAGCGRPHEAQQYGSRRVGRGRLLIEKVTHVRDAEGFWTVQSVEIV